MKKLTNKKLIDELIIGLKLFNIESINVDGDVVNYKNINNIPIDELIKANITISNKYVNYLVKRGIKLDNIIPLLDNKNPHCSLLTSSGKYLSFDVTHHSAEALIKRFVYVYLIELKFELGKKLELIYDKYFNDICDILESKCKDIGNNPIIHNLIKDILKSSSIHKIENTGRIRDEIAFTNRDNTHKKCNRYFNHPFLFIMEGNILQTVELYSSSQDFRGLNKFTKESNFKKILLSKLGRDL